MERDVERIPKNADTDIIIRIDDFGGKRGITIREFVRGERYTGFTKAGTRIPVEHFKAFKEAINSINENDLMEGIEALNAGNFGDLGKGKQKILEGEETEIKEGKGKGKGKVKNAKESEEMDEIGEEEI